MTLLLESSLLMFLALFALYSPLAAVSSYFPIVSKLTPGDQGKLAFGLFTYVAIFALVALWVGEPLLELLGLTTAALTVTGGIALIFEGVALMRGTEHAPAPPKAEQSEATKEGGAKPAPEAPWRAVLFMPVTFPLTVGGTTFAIIVSFRAGAKSLLEVIALSVAALVYAAVTGITVYASGHLQRRVSPKTRTLLERVAGILLTAIAVSLFGSGVPRMVVATLESMKH